MSDRSIDSPLDYCCWRRKTPKSEELEEVCLRCGKHYTGSLDQIIEVRVSHVCDPGKRQKIPKWALAGRKRRS